MVDRAGCVIISKNNKENIAVIFDSEDKFFIFPKGHIDEDETPENTAIREAMEETGLNIKIIKLLDIIDITSIYKSNDKYKLNFYLAESLDDNQDLNGYIEKWHINLNWINYKNVENVINYEPIKAFYKNNYKVIEEYINNTNIKV